MKQRLLAALLVLVTSGALADSITCTESFTQKYECTRFEGETECDVNSYNSATLNATLRIPGLGGFDFESTDTVELSLGSLSYSFTFDEAVDESTENRAVFLVTEFNDNEDEVIVGRLTLSRSGDVLTIVGSHRRLDSSIVADQHTEEGGAFSGGQDGVSFSLTVGSFGPIERQLYYKGSTTITRQRIGSGEEAETISLASVQVMGAADFVAPKTRLVFPPVNAPYRASNNVVDALFDVTENVAVAEVFAAVNGGEFVSAEQQEEDGFWTVPIELVAGTNTIATYAVDQDGNISVTNSQKVIFIIAKSFTLEVGPGGTVVGATNNQLLDPGRAYKLTARPARNFFFHRWTVVSEATGSRTETNLMLNFIMETNLVIRASFVTNKFLAIDGSYHGLFAPTNSEGQALVTTTNSGFLSLMLGDKGRFSGKLLLANGTLMFTGGSDLDGHAQVAITPRNQSQIVLDLVFGLNGDSENKGVFGTVSRDGWVATLKAVPAGAAGPLAGKYTFLIPGAPADQAAIEPPGDGAATATLAQGGVLTVAGALGDGTVLSGATPVSGTGEWPLFKSLYGGRGLVWGWAQFSTNRPHLTASNLAWIKPAGVPMSPLYTNGFSIARDLLGARYLAPPVGSNAIVWPGTNGVVFLDGGNLSETLNHRISLTKNKITVLDGNTNKLSLTITPGNGMVSGSFVHPETRRAALVKGVLLQLSSPDGIAGGWFKGTNESGYLRLEYAAPAP